MKANNVLLIEADMLWVRLINKIIERDPSIRITHIPRPERDVPFDAALHGRGVDIVIFDPSQTSEEERGWFYKIRSSSATALSPSIAYRASPR